MTTTTGPMLTLVSSTPRPSGATLLARATQRIERRRRLALLSAMTLCGLWGALAQPSRPAALVWLVALVLVPFTASVKPRPVRAGAIAALLCGPVLMPVVFGRGWGLVPSLVAFASGVAALLPNRN